MDDSSNKFTFLFFGIAAAAVLLMVVVIPLFANLFAGLGVEIPHWALRLFPGRPLRALLFAGAAALTAVVILAAILVILLRHSPQGS